MPLLNLKPLITLICAWYWTGFLVTGDCPNGWMSQLDGCYLLQPTAVEQAAAATLCNRYNATLACIASQEEYNMFSQLIRVGGPSTFWIGLQRGDNGVYLWTDGSPYSASYTHWVDGQEGYGYQVGISQCSTINSETGLVSFQPCNGQHWPLCERPANLPFTDVCNAEDGWLDLDGACYKISDVQSTWFDARQTCLRHNGDLFDPGSSPYVINKLVSCRESITHIWLGVSDTFQPGTWMSVNGGQANLSWATGADVILEQGNTCAEVVTSPTSILRFQSDVCSHEKKYICSKPYGTCPEGWYEHAGRCYQLRISDSDVTTWFLAKQACEDQGAQLLILNSLDEHNFISQTLVQGGVQYTWLGFSDEMAADVLTWVDGTPANGTGVFTVWTPSFPYLLPGRLDCGILHLGTSNGSWSNGYCFTLKPYVCEIHIGKVPSLPPTAVTAFSCEAGWLLFRDQCIFFSNEKTSWDSAEHICEVVNAHLVTITDAYLQSFLSINLPDVSVAWIGLRLDRNDRKYYWTDATLVNFTNYFPGEPDGADHGLDCIEMIGGSSNYDGGWNDQNCSRPQDYACQKAAVQTSGVTSPSSVTYSWSYRCGLGWQFNAHDNYCYMVMVGSPKTWLSARYDCMRRGGDLLSISGPNEQTLIEAMMRTGYSQYQGPFWLGATDSTHEGGWEWSDGTPFRYLHWHPGEPNNMYDTGEDCSVMIVRWNYEWNDRACDAVLDYICKKQAASPTDTFSVPTPPSTFQCEAQTVISGEYSIQSPFSFSSSSDFDYNHTGKDSRLIDSNQRSWRPTRDQKGEWVGVFFYQTMVFRGMSIAGEQNSYNFVTSFKLQYQFDSTSPWYWVENPPGTPQIFQGPLDDQTSATVIFLVPFQAQSVRVYPEEWNNHIAVRWELNGCITDQCQPDYSISGPLVTSDDALQASSESDTNHTAHHARLRPLTPDSTTSCWRPGDPLDPTSPPWIEANLGTVKILRGVTIMGNPDADEYVTLFQVQFHLNDGSNVFTTYQEPFGMLMNFTGNSNNTNSVTHFLKSSVPVQRVRLVPLASHNHVALRFDLLVCSVGCRDIALLSGTHNVSDSAFTASTSLDPLHSPQFSRLGQQFDASSGGAWVPRFNDAHQYIQVDLGEIIQLWGVATQGSEDLQWWIRSYTLAFSVDGATFRTHTGDGRLPRIFDGNYDATSVRKHYLVTSDTARFVQLWPMDFHNGIAVRWEIYGCPGPQSGTLEGCFLDNPEDRDLPYEPLMDPTAGIWPASCRSHCFQKGYFYAGLQNGHECYCGDTYGKFGNSVTSCTMHCQPPNDRDFCGGVNANFIYSTGLTPDNKFCPLGWRAMGDFCYSVLESKANWNDGRLTCQQMGADLASVNDRAENNFVFSLIVGGTGTGSAWIGLNDWEETFYYQWVDWSRVVYTEWDIGNPATDPTQQQHCVAINNQTGGWMTKDCGTELMPVCKMVKRISDVPQLPTVSTDCEKRDWMPFRSNCYGLVTDLHSWHDAKLVCQTSTAQLLRIQDQYEQAFVSSLLGSQSGYYWTDVSDTTSYGTFRYSDQGFVSFSYWGPGQPAPGKHCVALNTGQQAGLWYTTNCSEPQHAICQKLRIGFTLPPFVPPVPPSSRCPDDWFQTDYSCFQVNIRTSSSARLTWDEARRDCQDQGAELASFHGADDFNNVWRQWLAGEHDNYWIGLYYNDMEGSLKWSDGSGVNFLQWGPGESDSLQGLKNCVEIQVDTGNMVHQFCSALRNWVCSIARGSVPVPRTTLIAPSAGSPGSCSPLEDSWKMYAGSCYYVEPGASDNALTWRAARDWCRDLQAELVSITSLPEQLFVQSLLSNVTSMALWIGLNQLDLGRGMRWSDGSPTSFVNWNVNEPNNYGGSELCVQMLPKNGKWSDEHCTSTSGFICENTLGSTLPPTTATVPMTGYCPGGYGAIGNKCFRIYGNSLGERLLSWESARDFCRSLGSGYSLASVANLEENLFIVTLLDGDSVSAWLGLQRREDGSFAWVDNSEITFTRWDDNEPSGGMEACIYLRGTARYAGLWNDAPCGQQSTYVCQTYRNSSITTPEAIPNPCDVNLGFEPFQVGCYKYIQEPMTWTNASKSCNTVAADLPTVNDAFTQAFLQLFIRRKATSVGNVDGNGNPISVWIGLSDIKHNGQYTWNIGWPVTYSNWALGEPSQSPGGGCVSMGGGGMWADDACALQLPSVCVILNANPMFTPQPPIGQCVGSGWFAFGASCYLFLGEDRQSFYEARLRCEENHGYMVSIHDNVTQAFLASSIISQTPYSVWIGLYGSQDEGFAWIDGSAVQFTNWDTGEPSYRNDDNVEEHCVAINPKTLVWSDLDCGLHLGYICSKSQEHDTSGLTRPPMADPNAGQVPPTINQETPPAPSVPGTPALPSTASPSGLSSITILTPLKLSSVTSQTSKIFTLSTNHGVLPTVQGQTGAHTLSAGEIAGIVISVLMVTAASIIIILYVRYRQMKNNIPLAVEESQGFTNVMFTFNAASQQISSAPQTEAQRSSEA